MARSVLSVVFFALSFSAIAAGVLLSQHFFEIHFARVYCAIEPADLHRFTFDRVLLVVVGVGLGAVAIPLVRRLARSTPSAVAGGALRVALATVLALVVCDVYMRARGKAVPLVPPPNPLFRDDPVLGWTYVPSKTTVEHVGQTTTAYAINALGNRDVFDQAVPDPSVPSIIFAGESVAVGTTIPWEATYGAIIGADLRTQPVNVSVMVYANDQSYLRVVDALDRFPKTRAVVTLVVPEAISRNVREHHRRMTIGADGTLTWIDPAPGWWRSSPVRNLLMNATRYHSDEALRIARETVIQTDRTAQAHGAKSLFVMTNFMAPCLDPPGTSPIEEAVFGGTNVHWFRLDTDPALHVDGEFHPDARAHAILARAIEEALHAQGVDAL